MNYIYGKTPRCTYNAAGERIMKSYGTMEGVYINGAPQGITFHETPTQILRGYSFPVGVESQTHRQASVLSSEKRGKADSSRLPPEARTEKR